MKQFPIAILVSLYIVSFVLQVSHAGELSLMETDDTIGITLRGKPVLENVKTARPVPKGLAKHYSRSGYIHPACTPTVGEISGATLWIDGVGSAPGYQGNLAIPVFAGKHEIKVGEAKQPDLSR